MDIDRLSTSTTKTATLSDITTSSCPPCLLIDIASAHSNNTSNNNNNVTDDVTVIKNDVTAPYPWSNPENVISMETLKVIEASIFLGLNWGLLVMGSVGNVLSCVVFWRQGFKDRMNIFLFSLGLVDLCCVVSWFLMGTSQLVSYTMRLGTAPTPSQTYTVEWWKWTIRKYVRGFHRGFLVCSGCLLMLISVERCLVVWLPLRAATLVGSRTTVVSITLTVLLVHLMHLVYPVKFDVVSMFDEATNRTTATTRGTRAYQQHKEFFDYMEDVFLMIVLPLIIFTIVFIATVLTAVRLMRMVRWREGVASANVTMKKAQVSLVKMLLVVSIIYIATTTPKIIQGLVRTFVSKFARTGNYSNIFQATNMISFSLGTFNSTVNVFVYYSQSSRFRHELRQICPVLCLRHADPKDLTVGKPSRD